MTKRTETIYIKDNGKIKEAKFMKTETEEHKIYTNKRKYEQHERQNEWSDQIQVKGDMINAPTCKNTCEETREGIRGEEYRGC